MLSILHGMFWLYHCSSNATTLQSLVTAEDETVASSWFHDEDAKGKVNSPLMVMNDSGGRWGRGLSWQSEQTPMLYTSDWGSSCLPKLRN
jgi:hypothetical protein